jgi:hypothetical protein
MKDQSIIPLTRADKKLLKEFRAKYRTSKKLVEAAEILDRWNNERPERDSGGGCYAMSCAKIDFHDTERKIFGYFSPHKAKSNLFVPDLGGIFLTIYWWKDINDPARVLALLLAQAMYEDGVMPPDDK